MIRISKRTIVTIVLVSVSMSCIALAWDCDFVDSIEKKKVPIKYSVIFSDDAFNRAVTNLKAYCCDNYPEWINVCNSTDEVDDYPQSEYLYDHLVDVAFRNLDGFGWNYWYGLEPDVLWSEWRKFILKESESVTGWVAAKIGKEYDKYWKLKWYQYSDEFLSDYNNIEKVSLADKYYFVCDIVKNIIDIDSVWRDKLDSIYYDRCVAMAYNRIHDENLYVKTIMISASNQLLRSSFDAYLIKYFVQEKLSLLKMKLVEFVDSFYTIYKQAPVSKSCSK